MRINLTDGVGRPCHSAVAQTDTDLSTFPWSAVIWLSISDVIAGLPQLHLPDD